VLYLSGSPHEQGRQLGAGAAELIREQPRASGMIVLAADESRALALEVTDRAVREFEPEGDLLVRTNHFCAPGFAEYRSTFDRRARASQLLEQCRGRIGRRGRAGATSSACSVGVSQERSDRR
jgi:hypothetical protein